MKKLEKINLMIRLTKRHFKGWYVKNEKLINETQIIKSGEILSTNDCLKYYNISPERCEDLIRIGKIPISHIAGLTLIKNDDLMKTIKRVLMMSVVELKLALLKNIF